MKPETKRKLKIRILQTVVIVASVVLTKVAINYAYLERGYDAVGGEYFIPLLGLIVVWIIEEIYKYSERRRKQKHGKRRRKNK